MLAKLWKKVLLAVCIIACIYNIMSKLVNRASLEANLQRANDGNTVFDFSSDKSKDDSSEIVDGVVSKNVVTKNTIKNTTNTSRENETVEEDYQAEESNKVIEEENMNTEEQPEEKTENPNTFKFTDFIFNW